MNTHPALRAFLAGTFVPTLILPFWLAGFTLLRLAMQVSFPFERALVFPLALVPALWGVWNMLWLASHARTNLPVGLHGAMLPFLLAPGGAILASCLGILALGQQGVTWFQTWYVPYVLIAPAFLCTLAGYYLIWKYIVGFVNRVLGIA